VRIAVVGDLHLGRTARGLDRTPDVLAAWDAVLAEAAAAGCGALVQTGDVFDSSSPSPELTALAVGMFRRASEAFRTVALLVGNHDLRHGRDRTDALEPLREARLPGVTCATAATLVELGDGSGLLLLPYESRSRRLWSTPEEQDGRIRGLLGLLPLRGRTACVGHLDLPGASPSTESESRGGGHAWPSGRGWADRVSLLIDGHYHAPQEVRLPGWRLPVHCVGTPVALDFGEAGQVKRWMYADL
jgi:exonuclease SbcD